MVILPVNWVKVSFGQSVAYEPIPTTSPLIKPTCTPEKYSLVIPSSPLTNTRLPFPVVRMLPLLYIPFCSIVKFTCLSFEVKKWLSFQPVSTLEGDLFKSGLGASPYIFSFEFVASFDRYLVGEMCSRAFSTITFISF
jgi:hypothetical protein